MLPWVFFVVGYAQGSAQIGGEVKRASRTQYFAMVGGVLINGAVLGAARAGLPARGRQPVGQQPVATSNNTAPDKLAPARRRAAEHQLDRQHC